jgi:hypothetical protein
MSYGKKVGKFKPKVLALQGRGSGRKKNRNIYIYISQSLKIESFFFKNKPKQGLQCLIKCTEACFDKKKGPHLGFF